MTPLKERNCTNPGCFKNNTEVWRKHELRVDLKQVLWVKKKKKKKNPVRSFHGIILFDNIGFLFRNDYLKDAILC